MDVNWLDDEESRAWRAVATTSSRLLASLDSDLRANHQLHLADYEVLVYLSEAPEQRLRMSDLADRLALSPSGLTRRLDRLTDSGAVVREQCAKDRRGTFAVLTSAGLEILVAAAPTHVASVRRHLIDRLDRAELLALADTLGRIADR